MNSGLLSISVPLLSADSSDKTNQLLELLVMNATTSPLDTPFVPPAYAVRDNVLFSVSLGCSLFAAFAAVCGKQWLIYYRSIDLAISEKKEASVRQEKIKGAHNWKLRMILEMLVPTLLQVSLVLFAIGLVDLFRNINPTLGRWTEAISLLAATLSLVAIVLGILDPKCPFQNPISRFLHQAFCALLRVKIPLAPLQGALPCLPFFSVQSSTLPSIPPIPLDSFSEEDADDESLDAIRKSVVFTLNKADDPANTLAAVATIPSITSRRVTRKLAKEIGGDIKNLLSAFMLRLQAEESAGFHRGTVEKAALYARAALHFFVCPPLDENSSIDLDTEPDVHPQREYEATNWDIWLERIIDTISQADLEDTEIQYLRHGAMDKVIHQLPPSAVHLAAILRRYVDGLNHGSSEIGSSAQQNAAAFAAAATAAVGHPVPWASVSMSIQGIRLISHGASPSFLDWRRINNPRSDVDYLQAFVGNTFRSESYSAGAVWKIYKSCSAR